MNDFDFLDEQNEATEVKTFEITDDKLADWALKKIAQEYDERDRLTALANSEIEELLKKKEDLNRKCDSNTEYLKSALAKFFEGVKHKKTKTQETYTLLNGKLIKKYGKPKLSYDEENLLNYLKSSAPDYIEIKEKAKWGEFKKRTKLLESGEIMDTETGEILGFINVEQQSDTFDVKL